MLIVADIEPDLRSTPYQLGLLPWFSVSSLVLVSALVYWKFRYRWRLWSDIMLAGIWLGARLTGTGQSVTTRNGPSIER
ncbi:hypothetical protein [Marinobacter sp. LV10MA510-1]|uniref:hypothetical protein n=1 Tax=Marinobacter sp. LV10MA510-1 TaxID=1415567 RepID=UPI000C0173E8|nr:hypothetical protein [Marinobacter sp. LV10MA510-1]PFG10438.1 hypothetical protein ATI45_2880 [Marinobacter sp. LV10MA510-1]